MSLKCWWDIQVGIFNQLLGMRLRGLLLSFLFHRVHIFTSMEGKTGGWGDQLDHFSSWTIVHRQMLVITKQPSEACASSSQLLERELHFPTLY